MWEGSFNAYGYSSLPFNERELMAYIIAIVLVIVGMLIGLALGKIFGD